MKTIDLFAGGGGLSLGFNNAGFDIACAIENWQPAVEVYKANFKDHPVISLNLANVEEATKKIAEFNPAVIIGGPPCQDFSSAGKRDEEQGRASLTVSFAKIISASQPKYFVMENVARALKSGAFKDALDIFKRSGYGLTIKVLDAAYCGAPQYRKRLIVIGALAEHDGFMDDALEGGLSNTPMTIRNYFGTKIDFEYYYRHPRSYARRAVFGIDEPSPTIRGVNRPVPKGYPGHIGDAIVLNESIRCLTTIERAQIQTFPKNYKFPGTKTDIEQIIGNAVPVKLAEYVAIQLRNYINNNTKKSSQYSLFEPRKKYKVKGAVLASQSI